MRLNRLILIVVTIFMVITACTFRPLSGSLATVNGQPITRGELQVRVAIFDMFNDQTRDTGLLLEEIISERLLGQQAQAMGVTVTDAQLAVEMDRFFSSLDYRFQSRELAQNQLQMSGLTNDTIAEFLEDYLLAQGVITAVKDRVTVTAEELLTFYDEYRNSLYTFRSPPSRAWQILLPVGHDALAEELLLKAKAGGNLADLAREYSIDRASARRGGDLGYLTRATAPPEVVDIIFEIAPGEIHGPIAGTKGLYIVRVTERLGTGTIPFETAKDEVANRVLPDKQDQEYTAWFSALRDRSQITRSTAGRLSPGKNE